MQVVITYNDPSSFTKEEAVRNAMHIHGKHARVEVHPDSTNAHDFIYFGVQQIITHQQISLIFDKSLDYQKQLEILRAEVLNKLTEIVDTVIVDNESRVSA